MKINVPDNANSKEPVAWTDGERVYLYVEDYAYYIEIGPRGASVYDDAHDMNWRTLFPGDKIEIVL